MESTAVIRCMRLIASVNPFRIVDLFVDEQRALR